MKRFRKLLAFLIAALFILISQSVPVNQVFSLPSEISIYYNEIGDIREIFSETGLLAGNVQASGNNAAPLFKYIGNTSGGKGSVDLKLFGLTIKSVKVNVRPEKEVYAGGQCVGVAMYTKGLLVVGNTDVTVDDMQKRNPAVEAGLLVGDLIESANGNILKDINDLNTILDRNNGEPISLSIKRADKNLQLSITPAKDATEKKYRLGIWLRDSTAGIGTITYMNPSSKEFVALGHPITDNDTGLILPVGRGEIIQCDLNSIDKGKKGVPGELKGSFNSKAPSYGTITDNSIYGLYGVLKDKLPTNVYSNPIPIGSQAMVKEGKATILSTIDDIGVKEYEIEIIKTNAQSTRAPKGMVIKVTDQRLLDKTGGIVQGMSGSPIIQNGRLIGAVTHVLVSDPTKGYGIYIDWMYND